MGTFVCSVLGQGTTGCSGGGECCTVNGMVNLFCCQLLRYLFHSSVHYFPTSLVCKDDSHILNQ